MNLGVYMFIMYSAQSFKVTFLPRKQRVYFILEGKYMSLFKCYIFLKTIMINAQSNINRCLIFKPTISSLFRVL